MDMKRRHPHPGHPKAHLLATLALATTFLTCSGLAIAATAPHPLAPYIGTAYVTNVTYSSVVLHDYLNPRKQPTNYYFQYGTTRGYGGQTPLAPAGNGDIGIRVSQQVGGLQSATTYHYRFVATNTAGTSTSPDHTFTTLKMPLSLQIAGVPNPVSFGSPFTVEGSLTGTGSANHAVVLQVNPFPYTAGFKNLGNSELTSPTGAFSFPVVGLLENAQLRVMTVGPPLVVSPIVTEGVAVVVTFRAHRFRRHHHSYVRLFGTVTPAEPGALVGFQLVTVGEHTVNVGGTSVKTASGTTSRFSRTIRLRHRGLYRALVKVNDGGHMSAYSAPMLVR